MILVRLPELFTRSSQYRTGELMVGPVGFEHTTSGPDFSGSPAPQVYRPRLDSGILWAGSIPLTKLDDGPYGRNRIGLLFCVMLNACHTGIHRIDRGGLLGRGNRHLHDSLFDWIAFFSPAFHSVKHLFHFETKSSQFRGRFGRRVAEDAIAICHKYLVSGQ